MTYTSYPRIHEAMARVPKGTVRTYREIATETETNEMNVGKSLSLRRAYLDIPAWWRIIPTSRVLDDRDPERLFAQIAMLRKEGVKLTVRVEVDSG
ncbi:MAG: MGMT family protein [Gemmatimonadota bacterium]|nr:MGMT family protein [Gemmatimonadota bacterium]